MSDILAKYGSNGQTITIDPSSLADGSARESTVIDNGSNLFLDALVQLKLKTGGSGTSSTGWVDVYAYGTVDNGTTYPDNVTGSDAAITLVSPTNLVLIGKFNLVANSTTYTSKPMSVAAAFGGILPQKWGIVVVNHTGGTLDATAGNHVVKYQGVYGQVA